MAELCSGARVLATATPCPVLLRDKMSDERIPIQRYLFAFEEMDDEGLLYHEGLKKTIYLNETATIIWKLCDGTRTVKEIIDLLNQVYADTGETVDADVTSAIAALAAEGALRFGAGAKNDPA